VQAVLAVATVDSLFGARHATDARSLLEQANEWLTRLGMEGTKKMSMFRHHKLNLLRNTLGDEMAAAAAGHTSTAMVRTTYTRNERVVPLVNPFAA
jgi:integrase